MVPSPEKTSFLRNFLYVGYFLLAHIVLFLLYRELNVFSKLKYVRLRLEANIVKYNKKPCRNFGFEVRMTYLKLY